MGNLVLLSRWSHTCLGLHTYFRLTSWLLSAVVRSSSFARPSQSERLSYMSRTVWHRINKFHREIHADYIYSLPLHWIWRQRLLPAGSYQSSKKLPEISYCPSLGRPSIDGKEINAAIPKLSCWKLDGVIGNWPVTPLWPFQVTELPLHFFTLSS